MKVKEIEILIENNLHDLYRYISDKCDLPYVQTEFCEWVNAFPSPWPDYIFAADFSKAKIDDVANNIYNNIQHNKAPSFLIDKNSTHSSQLLEALSKHNIRLIMQWPGMALSLGDLVEKPNSSENLIIEVVSDMSNFQDWINIVNNELFPNSNLSSALFENLLESKEVLLLLGKINNSPVSTSMIFLKNNVAGIYMVSTSRNHRKMGIAQSMTNEAIKISKSNNCNYIVLEANRDSYNLYHKSGFQTFCTFDIYWKLPQP